MNRTDVVERPPTPRRAALTVIVLLSAFPAVQSVSAQAPAPAIDAEALQKRIEELEPDYPAPLRDIFELESSGRQALRLLGVSLVQSDSHLRGPRPQLDPRVPLVVVGHWYATATLASRYGGDVTFQDHLNLITRSVPLRIGPETGESPWEVGGVYLQRHEIDLEGLAPPFSGEGFLTVNLSARPGGRKSPIPLQMLPIVVKPVLKDRRISPQSLQRVVPPPYRPLGKFVRLCYGARTRIEIPEAWQRGNRRLAILSSLSYLSLPQGETACDIILNEGETVRATLPLRSGTMTARCDHDAYPQGRLGHDKATVFESRESSQLDWNGRPIQLHTYIGLADIPAGVDTITSLSLHCDAEVILDIIGIVLLPEDDPA